MQDMEVQDSVKEGRDVSVSQRQIYILSLLSENTKGYTADEIRERLRSWDIEVSKRTISRDIDELSLNYGIGEEERGGKTYFFADKYTLKNVDLTIEDLASLAFAKEMLAPYAHFEMGRHAVSFIDKIVKQSASLNQLQFDKLCGHFKQAGEHTGSKDHVDKKMERQLQNAIENHNKVTIAYHSYTGDEDTRRTIHPYRMLVLDSYLCIEAYCELRKENRRFRLSRIRAYEVLDAKYDASELEKEENESVFLKLSGGKVEDLELLFTGGSIRYVKEYEADRAKRLVEDAAGLHFYQKAAIAPDVIRWIRAFGPEVRVLAPAWLEEQLQSEAKKRLECGD